MLLIVAARSFGLDFVLPAIIVAAVIIAILPTVSWSHLRKRGRHSPMNHFSDDRYRLRLICYPRDADIVRDLSDDPFEPRIYAVPFAWPRTGLAWWNIAVAMFVIVIVFSHVTDRGWSRELFGSMSAFGLMGLLFIATLAVLWAWPTYLRVVPGRLDVVRYGFLGRSRPHVTKHNLRAAHVLVDLQKRVIAIGPPNRPHTLLQFGNVRHRTSLVRAVFEAARSKHPTPPLPDDALLG